jgi:hypothetical protein
VQLDLELEPANSHGAQAVAEAMRTNTTVTELDLGAGSPLNAAALAEIDNTLRINKFLANTESEPKAPPGGSESDRPPAQPDQPAQGFLDSYLPPQQTWGAPEDLSFSDAEAAAWRPPALALAPAEILAPDLGSYSRQAPAPAPAPALAPPPAPAPAPALPPPPPPAPDAVSDGLLEKNESGGTTGQHSPKAMLELLRRKLDAFQEGGRADATPPASAPAVWGSPTLGQRSPPHALSTSPAAAMPLASAPVAAHASPSVSPRVGDGATVDALATRLAAVEAASTATAAAIRAELDRRVGNAIGSFQAEDQAKQYVQEIRLEQLARRLAALEQQGPPQVQPQSAAGAVSAPQIAELLRGPPPCLPHTSQSGQNFDAVEWKIKNMPVSSPKW